eukprot:tig00000718_g3717.t1
MLRRLASVSGRSARPWRLVRTLSDAAAPPQPPPATQYGFPGYVAAPPALTYEFSREYLDYADRHLIGAKTIYTAATEQQLASTDDGAYIEVAFAGRSNVGKSSLLNALLRHDGLVTTSKTPGCTKKLTFLRTAKLPKLLMVDMPGYGYARLPHKEKDAFNKLMGYYVTERKQLARVFVLVDSRVGLKKIDEEFMDMLDQYGRPYQLVLTKIDQLSTPQLRAVGQELYEATRKGHAACYPVTLAASAHKGWGLPELRAAVIEAATLRPDEIEDPAGINFDAFEVPGEDPERPIVAPARGPFEEASRRRRSPAASGG